MVDNRRVRVVVSREERLSLVSYEQRLIRKFIYNLSVSGQRSLLPERDTVSDQADGARGAAETLRVVSLACKRCQKARENGRLSARGRAERRNQV